MHRPEEDLERAEVPQADPPVLIQVGAVEQVLWALRRRLLQSEADCKRAEVSHVHCTAVTVEVAADAVLFFLTFIRHTVRVRFSLLLVLWILLPYLYLLNNYKFSLYILIRLLFSMLFFS